VRLRNFYVIADRKRCAPQRHGIYKINRPSRLRRAIGIDLDFLSICHASPNDMKIVIISIIIIIGEVIVVEHWGRL
jgi:hypothetical protein